MQQCQLLVGQPALTRMGINQLLRHEINGHGIDREIPPEKILLQRAGFHLGILSGNRVDLPPG